jgi:hypothetical protein
LAASVPFGAAILLVDRIVVFPADINAPFPTSLSFYPSIGWLAEIVFHVVPFAILLGALVPRVRADRRRRLIALVIVAVAAIEPAFQLAFSSEAEHFPRAAAAYVAAHVFALNLVQFELFRRYGFLSMYALRLGYYCVWHIGWGHARLQILFG